MKKQQQQSLYVYNYIQQSTFVSYLDAASNTKSTFMPVFALVSMNGTL